MIRRKRAIGALLLLASLTLPAGSARAQTGFSQTRSDQIRSGHRRSGQTRSSPASSEPTGSASPAPAPASADPGAAQPPAQDSGTPADPLLASPSAETPAAPDGAAAAAQPGTGATPNTVPNTAPDCVGAGCQQPAPHITIATPTPAPAPAPWPWQQRVAWGANIVLAVLAYVALMMGLSLLRKIGRQTEYVEIAAQGAADAARAALVLAQAVARADRPWILMSVRPAQNVEDGFSIVATNRGRGPAQILSTVDAIVSAVDEGHLAAEPEFRNEPAAPAEPTILLPGEATELLSFSRADVKRICESEERLARVEKWEEKIYLYGRVTYCDLTAPEYTPAYESGWFAWYIHGRQKSGMVMAGPTAYNRHS